MSFGESAISAGFIQKSIKVDLDVRVNRAYPRRNGHQKTLEDSRGLHTEEGAETPPGGAARPHLEAARPPRVPSISLVAMSVLHRLLGCFYTIL